MNRRGALSIVLILQKTHSLNTHPREIILGLLLQWLMVQ
nr:MAG TPA: hypothetical protein [Crassvirales sp.]DAQ19795.1 MAG TPA: hypothetical protein [Caudoviricetes sp.]